MKVAFSLVTWATPALGIVSIYLEYPIVFWLGVGIATVNLFLNLASGAMKCRCCL